jgi:hypothetical protein
MSIKQHHLLLILLIKDFTETSWETLLLLIIIIIIIISRPHNLETSFSINGPKISNTLLQTIIIIQIRYTLIRVVPILIKKDILNNTSTSIKPLIHGIRIILSRIINGIKIIPSTKTLLRLDLMFGGIMGTPGSPNRWDNRIRDTHNRETLISGPHVWVRPIDDRI